MLSKFKLKLFWVETTITLQRSTKPSLTQKPLNAETFSTIIMKIKPRDLVFSRFSFFETLLPDNSTHVERDTRQIMTTGKAYHLVSTGSC